MDMDGECEFVFSLILIEYGATCFPDINHSDGYWDGVFIMTEDV